MTNRQRRIAENESRFREINERLEADLKRLPDDGAPVQYVCECGRADCAQLVSLVRDDYERVRADPRTFVVVPGHELADFEDVAVMTETHVVVRKKPETAPLVGQTDPRT